MFYYLSPENICTNNTIWTERIIFRNIMYVHYTKMHAITNHSKNYREYEGEYEWAYEKVWREKRREENL